MFYSKKRQVLHSIIRGNFCSRCNSKCAKAARLAQPKKEHKEYTGYLELLHVKVLAGTVSWYEFEFAKEMNPHGIIRPKTNPMEQNQERKEKVEKKVKCESCNDTGTYFIPNGPDDSDEVFCECSRGSELLREAERLVAHYD